MNCSSDCIRDRAVHDYSGASVEDFHLTSIEVWIYDDFIIFFIMGTELKLKNINFLLIKGPKAVKLLQRPVIW